MTPASTENRPRSESDWEQWRGLFTTLYRDQNKTLKEVRMILNQEHHFNPSEKQCKNKIKAWGLKKYLAKNEAQQIVDNQIATTDDMKRKAERALKRKRGREKVQRAGSPSSERSSLSPSPPVDDSPQEASTPPVSQIVELSFQPTFSQPMTLSRSESLVEYTPNDRFINNFRRWTNAAFVEGHWNELTSDEHKRARDSARYFSTNLTTGVDLHRAGQVTLAFIHWNRAFASLKDELLKNWYYETPMRLLFEISRLVHSEHSQFAEMLLRHIAIWSGETYVSNSDVQQDQYDSFDQLEISHTPDSVDRSDARYALFASFGQLKVENLQELYKRAARCMIDEIVSRMPADHLLQYEVRLNRALDMVWFEPLLDLGNWVFSAEYVDTKLGRHNEYSIYYLHLEAYKWAAEGQYDEAEKVCIQIKERLNAPEADRRVDRWRIGLAYRRLGRILHDRGQQPGCTNAKALYQQARRNFNAALRYVSYDSKLKASVLVGICHCQLDMARQIDDQDDMFLWNEMLTQLQSQNSEDAAKWQNMLNDLSNQIQGRLPADWKYESQMLLPDADGSYHSSKRQRMDLSPNRRGTY